MSQHALRLGVPGWIQQVGGFSILPVPGEAQSRDQIPVPGPIQIQILIRVDRARVSGVPDGGGGVRGRVRGEGDVSLQTPERVRAEPGGPVHPQVQRRGHRGSVREYRPNRTEPPVLPARPPPPAAVRACTRIINK